MRQVDPLLSSPGSRRRQLADESVDVTTYLIHRMLGAPAQVPNDGSWLAADAGKKAGKDAEDKHSEAGTYTIDDEEDEAVKQSVAEARECIDDVFGIGSSTENKTSDASSRLVRPVIEAKHTVEPGGTEVDGDEDVFIDADVDDTRRHHYVCSMLVQFTFHLFVFFTVLILIMLLMTWQ